MDCDVNTTVQISKILAPNSGEPFVVETKTTTTTTTTTTTKRICVGKDANVDLTEIQALLDDDDGSDNQLTTHHHADAAAAVALDTVPPKANVNITTTTTKHNKSKQRPHETTVDKSKCDKSKKHSTKRNTTAKRLSDANHSPLLSSTKIEDSLKTSSQNKSHDSFKEQQQQKSATQIVVSPNLSKISTNSGKSNSKTKKIIKKNSNSDNDTQKIKTAVTKQVKKKRKKPAAAPRKSVKCGKMAPPQSTRTLRSKVESQDPKYIDDLINKYIALDKKPSSRRKRPRAAMPKVEKPAPIVPPPAIPQPPPIDLPDLSAIFESSIEDETAAIAAPATVSTGESAGGSSSFDAAGNALDFIDEDWGPFDDHQVLPTLSSTANEQLPELSTASVTNEVDAADVVTPLKEHTKSNRTKRKLPPSDTSEQKVAKQTNEIAAKRSKKTVKKEPSTTKKSTAKTTTTTATTTMMTPKKPAQSVVECDSTTKTATEIPCVASAINESVRSAINYQPIKLYSPSHRGRLRTVANNKLILSKRSITKKVQNLPTPSKNSILERFSGSHPMTIDADSRLIWLYPNANGENDDNNGGGGSTGKDNDKGDAGNGIEDSIASHKNTGMDMLMRLQQTKRPLLVKEILADEL